MAEENQKDSSYASMGGSDQGIQYKLCFETDFNGNEGEFWKAFMEVVNSRDLRLRGRKGWTDSMIARARDIRRTRLDDIAKRCWDYACLRNDEEELKTQIRTHVERYERGEKHISGNLRVAALRLVTDTEIEDQKVRKIIGSLSSRIPCNLHWSLVICATQSNHRDESQLARILPELVFLHLTTETVTRPTVIPDS
jgi:hypothetical protein